MATSIGDSGPYSGEVTPGGPPDTRELAGLMVTKLAVDPKMSNNCYLLRCRATDEQVLIDAAAEPARLLELIGTTGITRVITTHQHWDHHRALADVVAATGAVVVAGPTTPPPSPSRPAWPSTTPCSTATPSSSATCGSR